MANLEPEKELHFLLKEQNALLKRQIKDNNNWGMILLRGMVMGLGTAIGATVILSLAIWALQPLREIQPLRPTIERLVITLDKLEKARAGASLRDKEEPGEATPQASPEPDSPQPEAGGR